MDTHALASLACPACGGSLAESAGTLRCANDHAYDIARQGYVNLLASNRHLNSADTAAMIDARAEFLGTGHYAPIAEAITRQLSAHLGSDAIGVIADAGAGTGYYLARVLNDLAGFSGVALDISKYAARRAARVHDRIVSAVCDTWQRLPLADGGVAAVLCVFSPRNVEEFARVLAPDGVLIMVTPRQEHLRELVEALGLIGMQEDKEARLLESTESRFEVVTREEVNATIVLNREEALTAAAMGPSAQHVTPSDLESRIAELAETTAVTLAVTLHVLRVRS